MAKTNKQLAKELGIQIEKINAWIAEGLIPTLKTERKRYIDMRTGLIESELFATIDDTDADIIVDALKISEAKLPIYA